MIALLQRVTRASVTVEGKVVGQIEKGLLVLLGIRDDDREDNARRLASKVIQLRAFSDHSGKMNLSALDIQGQILVVSQFTLYGDTDKGNRPSYSHAASPDLANPLYLLFTEECRRSGLAVETGIFGAHMKVELENDGPVTFLCRSENK